jgi:hypothetical protein
MSRHIDAVRIIHEMIAEAVLKDDHHAVEVLEDVEDRINQKWWERLKEDAGWIMGRSATRRDHVDHDDD